MGLALLSFGVLAFPRLARADDVSASARVSADRAEEEHDSVETIVVRGVRTGTLEHDGTVFTDTVDLRAAVGEQLRLEDVLSELPGVQIRRFGGPGDPSEISIRGSTSAQVVVRLDGVRLDTAQSGSVDLSTLPIELFERVDVRRGGGAVHVGSGAIGGVVDLEPRWPEPDADPLTTLRASGGSFDTWDGSLFHGRHVGGTDVALGYSGFTTDGDFTFQRPVFEQGGVTTAFDPASVRRINNASQQHAGIATLRRELASGDELRFMNLASYVSRGTPGLAAGAGPTAGQRTDAHSRTVRSIGQLALETHEGRPVTGSARVSYHYESNHFRDPVPLLAAGEPIDVETDGTALAGRLELGWSPEAAGIAMPIATRVDAGFDGRREGLDSTDRANVRRNVFGGWLRSEVGPGPFGARVVPSVRVDATGGFGARWLPALGLSLDPLPWLRLRAHVERSYRAPSFDELYFPDQGFARGNPALDPERALVADGGIEIALDRVGPAHDVTLSVSGFFHDLDDSIVWLVISPQTIQPQNTGRAREIGAEVALRAELGALARVGANLTWLEAEYDRGGAPLPGRVPLEVSGWLQLGDPERWKLGVDVQYAGRIPVNELGTIRLPARTTVDLVASAELRSLLARLAPGRADVAGSSSVFDALWLGLRVRNVGDRSVRDARFFPQPGRTLSVTVEGRFR